jgi:hypothetical protein
MSMSWFSGCVSIGQLPEQRNGTRFVLDSPGSADVKKVDWQANRSVTLSTNVKMTYLE